MRVDPVLGTRVHVVGDRQARPNQPSAGCPFCVGGLEAPADYDVRWFPNRWPAMDGDRCEVVLYTPTHDASFSSLGTCDARKVIDLWADRTTQLGSRDDVDYVLVFENRGARGGSDDRPPPWPDLRLRPRAQSTVAPARCRMGAVRLGGRRHAAGADDRRIRRVAGVGAVGTHVPDLGRDRATRTDRRPADDDRRRTRRAGDDLDRRARSARSGLRAAGALHDVAQPATDGRHRVRRRLVQRRDRFDMARCQRAALHRRRRGGERGVLQPDRAGGHRPPVAIRR